MRIGQLAARAQVNIQTLRFYEREGLLRPPLRTASGYRSYEPADLDLVRFIRLCQSLGFTLREVRQLLHLHTHCAAKTAAGQKTMQPEAVTEIVELARERISAIDQKIGELAGMRAELAALLQALTPTTPGGAAAVCPISHESLGK